MADILHLFLTRTIITCIFLTCILSAQDPPDTNLSSEPVSGASFSIEDIRGYQPGRHNFEISGLFSPTKFISSRRFDHLDGGRYRLGYSYNNRSNFSFNIYNQSAVDGSLLALLNPVWDLALLRKQIRTSVYNSTIGRSLFLGRGNLLVSAYGSLDFYSDIYIGSDSYYFTGIYDGVPGTYYVEQDFIYDLARLRQGVSMNVGLSDRMDLGVVFDSVFGIYHSMYIQYYYHNLFDDNTGRWDGPVIPDATELTFNILPAASLRMALSEKSVFSIATRHNLYFHPGLMSEDLLSSSHFLEAGLDLSGGDFRYKIDRIRDFNRGFTFSSWPRRGHSRFILKGSISTKLVYYYTQAELPLTAYLNFTMNYGISDRLNINLWNGFYFNKRLNYWESPFEYKYDLWFRLRGKKLSSGERSLIRPEFLKRGERCHEPHLLFGFKLEQSWDDEELDSYVDLFMIANKRRIGITDWFNLDLMLLFGGSISQYSGYYYYAFPPLGYSFLLSEGNVLTEGYRWFLLRYDLKFHLKKAYWYLSHAVSPPAGGNQGLQILFFKHNIQAGLKLVF